MALILVVDDDDQVRKFLRHMLERDGHQAIEAAEGRTALKHCREQPVALVITDLIMPEQEGLETIRELRRDFPDLPVIAISGGGTAQPHEYLSLAKAFGAHRVFAKPFSLQDIRLAIKELL